MLQFIMNFFTVFFLIIVIFFSIICSIQDLKQMSVNKILLIFANLSVAIFHLVYDLKTSWIYFLSAIIFGLFYFLVRKISKNKFGLGDVFFGIFQGFCLHPYLLSVCVFLEILSTLPFLKHLKKIKKFPFIPFMAFSLVITLVIFDFLKFYKIFPKNL